MRYEQGLSFLKKNSSTFTDKVLSCLHSHLKHSADTGEVLSCALNMVATHGWEKVPDTSFGYEAIQTLSTRFSAPLQEAQVNMLFFNKSFLKPSNNLFDRWKLLKINQF